MYEKQTFTDEDFSPGWSSVHQKRSDPEFSCVSMRSDGSMKPPLHFKNEETRTVCSQPRVRVLVLMSVPLKWIEVLVTDVPPALAGAVAPLPSTGTTPQPPAVADTEETEPSEVGSGSSGETFQIEPDMHWKSQVENVARFLHFMDPQQPSLLFVRNREKSKLYLDEAKLTKQTPLNHLKSLKRDVQRAVSMQQFVAVHKVQAVHRVHRVSAEKLREISERGNRPEEVDEWKNRTANPNKDGAVMGVKEHKTSARRRVYGVKPVTSQMARKVFETAAKSLDDSERAFVTDYLTHSTATADEHYLMKTAKDVVFARKLLAQLGGESGSEPEAQAGKTPSPLSSGSEAESTHAPEEKIDVQKAYDTLLLAHPVTLDGEVPDRSHTLPGDFQKKNMSLVGLRADDVTRFGCWIGYRRALLHLGHCHRAACFFD
ncbi:putative protein NLRC3 [Triplophysa rosa]|uniref:Uncharacterized protein n=1 Tax=Triplophysa rosa TaxID=992332 RepID=A0A9W7TRU9_TRIRA|nr:putative protein NLRC3 [Triplophysa rosa]